MHSGGRQRSTTIIDTRWDDHTVEDARRNRVGRLRDGGAQVSVAGKVTTVRYRTGRVEELTFHESDPGDALADVRDSTGE